MLILVLKDQIYVLVLVSQVLVLASLVLVGLVLVQSLLTSLVKWLLKQGERGADMQHNKQD